MKTLIFTMIAFLCGFLLALAFIENPQIRVTYDKAGATCKPLTIGVIVNGHEENHNVEYCK
jgi:hypothetical protein